MQTHKRVLTALPLTHTDTHSHTRPYSITEQTTGYKMTDVFANLIHTYIQIKRYTESVTTSTQNRCFGVNRIVSTLLLLSLLLLVLSLSLLFFMSNHKF